MLKCWNHPTTARNYAVTYYKTLKEVPRHLGLEELKKYRKIFEKTWEKLWKLL